MNYKRVMNKNKGENMEEIKGLTGNPERASRIEQQMKFLESIKDHYNPTTWTDMRIELVSLCYGHYLENTEQEEGNALIDNALVEYIMENNPDTEIMKNMLKVWISLVFNRANAQIDRYQKDIHIQK